MEILQFKVMSRILVDVQTWSGSQLPELAEREYNTGKSNTDKPFTQAVDQVSAQAEV
jgi:hypothetical protein